MKLTGKHEANKCHARISAVDRVLSGCLAVGGKLPRRGWRDRLHDCMHSHRSRVWLSPFVPGGAWHCAVHNSNVGAGSVCVSRRQQHEYSPADKQRCADP